MRKIRFSKFFIVILSIFLIIFSVSIFSKEATIILKNGRVLDGIIIEEDKKNLIINCDLGKITLERDIVFSIIYKDDSKFKNINEFVKKETIFNSKDRDNDIYCELLAKTETVIVVQTESEKLTVDKKNIKK